MKKKKKAPPGTVFTNAVSPAVFRPSITKKGTELSLNATITPAMFHRSMKAQNKR